jgi:GntR family transcriptional regulator/MocR family aminotransferase
VGFAERDERLESLQGLDRAGRVVYLGTFSTVLFPPLRVGYAVLPPDLVEPFVRAKWLADRQTSTLEQLALTDFLVEGHYATHLGRMRRLAASRRAALLDAIASHLGEAVEPSGAAAGMHLTLGLRGAAGSSGVATERQIASRAAAMGVGVYPLHPYCVEPRESPALILGYAALPTDRIREGIRRLAEAIGS